MRFNFNIPRFQGGTAQASGRSTRRQENRPDIPMATGSGTAGRARSAAEPSPIHRPSSGGGMRGWLSRLANRGAKRGPHAREANQNAEGAGQSRTSQNPQRIAGPHIFPSATSGTFGVREIPQIQITKEMNSEALLNSLRSSLEGIETVTGALEEIRTRLNNIRQGFEQIHRLQRSHAGGSGLQEADAQAGMGAELSDWLEGIKREFDALQEMAFRTEKHAKPAQLRSMTTALRGLRDLTSGTIVFNEPLPVDLVRLSWDVTEILGKSLATGDQSEETAARFQDLGDPTRYRPDQSDRPINEQVLGVHGAMIVREIEGLNNIHQRLQTIIGMLEGARTNPALTDPMANPSRVRHSPVGQQATAFQREPVNTTLNGAPEEVQSKTAPRHDSSNQASSTPHENYWLFWESQGGDPSLNDGGRANSR